ncbi:MAG: uroporphyrinogen decarboxylase family protein [Spirochaetia bacterium]|jgi:uroporphyrinogen decarboxylase
MDSRERVLASINHERPDRIPCDLWAEPGVWERLVKDLGVDTEEAVRKALDVDIRYISPVYPADTITRGVKQNMWGERWEKTSTVFGYEWEHTRGALFDAQTVADLEAFPWPTCDQVDYSTVAEQVKKAEGYAIFYGNADFFERPGLVRGLENILVDVMVNQDMVDYLQEKFLTFFIEDFYRTMEAAGRKIDVFWALTDLGTQGGLLMGQGAMGRYIFKPLKVMADVVHGEGVKMMFHSCGSVRDAIPGLIESGVDILNPIQPAAKGMEPVALKKDFGGQIAFHGGIDIQYLLPRESPDVVRAEARRVAHVLCDQGGYVLAPSHNLQLDTPTQNILAMYGMEARRL